MPNIVVPATGEPMPAATFNRRAIMQAAWTRYRHWHSVRESIHAPPPLQPCRVRFQASARMGRGKARRREQIERQLDGLNYKSAHINIEPRRRELQSALAAIAA